MKLLIDEDILHHIIKLMDKHFQKSIRVSLIRENRFTDLDIGHYAKENEFIIINYDEDFYEWQILRGYPPKLFG